MAYLDTILSAAMQGPSDDDKDTLRRLSRIANSGMGAPAAGPGFESSPTAPRDYQTPIMPTTRPAPNLVQATSDSDSRRYIPDQTKSPEANTQTYLASVASGAAAPEGEQLPPRTVPERAYPPAEGTDYQGFEVPPRTAIGNKLADILEQKAALQYPGPHDISKTRRILADLAGGLTGILGVNPMAGIGMAEAIKSQPFHQALSALNRKQEAYTTELGEEQKRTTEAANIYKAERTADIGQQRADTGAGTLAERVISDRRHAEQLAKNEDDINAHRAINENIATGKLLLTGTIAEKRDQLARELEKEREIAAQKRTETAGEYNVKAAGARATAAKEPGESQVAAAKGIVEQALETDDPLIRQRLLDSLGTQEKAEAQKTNPELFKHKKILPAEAIPLGKTKTTLDLIDGIRTRIAKRPEILGPILGRIERGEGAIGTQDADVAGLETDLNNLLLNESGMYGGTRPSIALVRQIKEGGISKVSNMMSQFVGKLDATENAAKINYKNLSGDEYKRKSKYKVEVLGDAPKQ
jgi:hypothetical protein